MMVSEPFHVKFPLIVTSPSQNSIAPQTFLSQYKNTCFIFKVKKKDQMTCYFFHLWIWQMDLVLNNFASYQNVKLSLKLKFMQILVPPHRGHKLCKPSSGKETIKYKPWGILLAYSETLFEIHTKTISLKTENTGKKLTVAKSGSSGGWPRRFIAKKKTKFTRKNIKNKNVLDLKKME